MEIEEVQKRFSIKPNKLEAKHRRKFNDFCKKNTKQMM